MLRLNEWHIRSCSMCRGLISNERPSVHCDDGTSVSPEWAATLCSLGNGSSRWPPPEFEGDRNDAHRVELVERELVNWVCCEDGLCVTPDDAHDPTEDTLVPLSLQQPSGLKWRGDVVSFNIRTISSVSNPDASSPETVGIRWLFCSLDANRFDSDRIRDDVWRPGGCPP